MFQETQTKFDPDPYQGGPLFVPPVQPVIANPLKIAPVFMQAADIDAFLEIQAKVRPTLAKDYHLKERTAADLHHHLNERMPLIGARAFFGDNDTEGTLVAGCLLSLLKNEEGLKNLAGYPIADWQKPTSAVIQTLCVDPAYKGRKISQIVLDAAFSAAAEKGMTQIFTAIADDNADSIRAFTKKNGYKPFAHGVDEAKGYAKTYYRAPVFGCNAT